MVICIIAEGSYPYITGGVSAWIHQLIQGMPEVHFKILSLMPSFKENLEYRYRLPSNLIEIKTIYLDDYLKLNHKSINKKLNFNTDEAENLEKFLSMDKECDWSQVIKLLRNKAKAGNSIDFLQSTFFWDTVLKMYNERFADEIFNTFFWTIRTMMLPFINLFQGNIIEADIYHAVSTGYAGILGVYMRELTGNPFLLTEHGIYAREREEEILKAKWVTGVYKQLWIDFFYFISRAAYKNADKIVSLFERNRNIQVQLGAEIEKTIVIPNGVDLERYNIVKKAHKGYNVGAILRIVPIKDVMTMIRAFKIVKDIVKTSKLYLIGPMDEDKDYYNQCAELIKILSLEESVIFTGRVDVKEYLKIIDVLVLTSISEGQPLVILEGMASEIPTVSTDVGSCRELLEADENEGSCGIVTSLVSPKETAEQIIKLLKDNVMKENMGYNGRRRVERKYSMEKFINSYASIYKELEFNYGRNWIYSKKII
ncbi:putative glycosyltransferase EpsD [Clostridium homopropionicum DSM 5847]|uniref:Putative glycosyltransferase EpsD n=1 Tax=Clostridium homopropionicum DSM 5847 TaxID=1121318 RepID=A0A0L6ZCI5_9CLOT|nr:GT4 family glycosyltransferase PelF [Clostridium homopropionicum]KOA20667.1 putative glycosyltransferase EpsD [Clostridium homopropionicum DSM 5847]SFF91911.1 Glycosyltransferase involved in cell wall bisynthesis [Clostridium homopropionicum]